LGILQQVVRYKAQAESQHRPARGLGEFWTF
jgi:hypothetical protein